MKIKSVEKGAAFLDELATHSPGSAGLDLKVVAGAKGIAARLYTLVSGADYLRD